MDNGLGELQCNYEVLVKIPRETGEEINRLLKIVGGTVGEFIQSALESSVENLNCLYEDD